jgi:hypothetical protein
MKIMSKEHYEQFRTERKNLLKDKVFDYDYGDLGEKLRPGGELHSKLVTFHEDNAFRALNHFLPCHDLWREADWACTMFVKPEDANPRNTKKDRKRTIVHTMSFEAEENFCAAFQRVFNQDPVFKFKPYPGQESMLNAAVAEYMVQRHVLWGDFMLHADSVVRSGFRYGIGMGNLSIETERGYRPVDLEVTEQALAMAEKMAGEKMPRDLKGKILRDMEEVIVAEYNQLTPWDVYNSFYDPSVTGDNMRKATYRGTTYTVDPQVLLQRERENPGQWFNGWYAKLLAEKGEGWSRFNNKHFSGREDRMGTAYTSIGESAERDNQFGRIDITYWEVQIIPSDMGCGDETYPVRYMLAVAADEIVVGFSRLDLYHGGDNGVFVAPNSDGHSLVPTSHISSTMGIQNHIDHIMRCQQASMAKNVNGAITIFNHNILNIDDYRASGEVGKFVRPVQPALTEEMMRAALVHIPHPDNSGQHIQWIQYLGQVARGNGGFDIGAPGAMADAERTTKYGVQAQQQATSARFQRLAFKIGAQFMTTTGWKMVHNLQQFCNNPINVDLAGRYAERLAKGLGMDPNAANFMVTPSSIDINFEMEPYTGAMPQMDDTQGLQMILQMTPPEMIAEGMQGIPMRSIIREILRKSGFENIDDFPVEQMQTQAMPDQAVQEQVQQGNLVPATPQMMGA